MDWTDMGIRKVPDLPCAHEDPNAKAGTGKELSTRVCINQATCS